VRGTWRRFFGPTSAPTICALPEQLQKRGGGDGAQGCCSRVWLRGIVAASLPLAVWWRWWLGRRVPRGGAAAWRRLGRAALEVSPGNGRARSLQIPWIIHAARSPVLASPVSCRISALHTSGTSSTRRGSWLSVAQHLSRLIACSLVIASLTNIAVVLDRPIEMSVTRTLSRAPNSMYRSRGAMRSCRSCLPVNAKYSLRVSMYAFRYFT